jgi:hypothetical protein
MDRAVALFENGPEAVIIQGEKLPKHFKKS